MSELLRELEEDIRNEKYERLWHSLGKLMIAASIGVVLVTIAVVVWQDRKQAYATNQTSQFIKGLDRFNVEDYKGAIVVFSALAEDEHSSYFGMAMLRKAQAQILSGDKNGAMKTYQALVDQGGGEENRVFIELARIIVADTPAKLIDVDSDSPLYHTQSEWKAWQLYGQGKKKEAVEVFAALRDDERAPSTLRDRATQVIQHISPDMAAPRPNPVKE
jgi:hypothetical protein